MIDENWQLGLKIRGANFGRAAATLNFVAVCVSKAKRKWREAKLRVIEISFWNDSIIARSEASRQKIKDLSRFFAFASLQAGASSSV